MQRSEHSECYSNTVHTCESLLRYAVALRQNAQICTRPNVQVEFITPLYQVIGRCRENRLNTEIFVDLCLRKIIIATTEDNETFWMRGVYLSRHVKLQS